MISFLYAIKLFISDLLSSLSLPSLIHNIGLAYLGILIPMVIFIFQNKEDDKFNWDKIVILDYVINVKINFICIAFIFLGFLFLENYYIILKFVFLIGFFISLFFLFRSLRTTYQWIKTVEVRDKYAIKSIRNEFRNKYLQKLTDPIQIENVWSLTWPQNIKNESEEINLIEKFIDHIKLLLNNKNAEALNNCLDIFHIHREKRILNHRTLIFASFLENLLEWYFPKSNINTNYEFNGTEIRLNQLFKFFFSIGVTKKGFQSILFNKLKVYLSNKKLLSVICDIFFESIGESRWHSEIWQHFPSEWKIAGPILADSDAAFWLEKFLNWASFKDEATHKSLDKLISGLFPSVYPDWWQASSFYNNETLG